MLIRAGLVLDKHVYVTVSAGGGFQAVEHVAEILAQIIFDKGAGLQLQRAEVTDGPQFGRQMDIHEVAGYFGLRQKLPESGIMGRWIFFHEAIVTCSVAGSLWLREGFTRSPGRIASGCCCRQVFNIR